MPLDEMAAHTCACRNCPLEVHSAILSEGSKICTPQGFRCYANFEGRLVERGYGQTCAVHTNAVAQCAICEDLGSIGNRKRSSPIFALGIELGDG